MSEALPPTLEDLRDVAEAAWLWDGARARIVWANASGLTYFSAATLYDLIDRPFDFTESGVEQIAHLQRSLQRGQVSDALLHFPSAGNTAPLPVRCMVHRLADGRAGVLVVAKSGTIQAPGVAAGDVLQAFDLLPQAALLVGRDGTIQHLNAAALLLLGARQRASLATALSSSLLADDILARVSAAGTVSVVETAEVRLGKRDLRITARRLNLPGAGAAFALVLLDDVTERRVLERGQATARPSLREEIKGEEQAKPAAALSTVEAFDQLGKVLKQEAAPEVAPAAEVAATEDRLQPAPDKPKQKRDVARVPDIIRAPIERLQDAVIVAKDGKLLIANVAAVKLFGLESAKDLVNDQLLWDRFAPLGQSLPATDIAYGSGKSLTASVQMSLIPWQGGPARQFVLKPVAPEKAEAVALKVVPVAKVEKPEPVQQAVLPAPEVQNPSPPELVKSAEVIPLRRETPEADDELRAILDTAADGIITLDANARIHTFSAGAEAIFGYRIAEVAGRPLAEFLAPESRKVMADYLAALQGPGLKSVFNDGREVTAIVKQGGSVPLFLTLGKLQAPRSQAAFCAVVRDITQWKKTEADLREAKEAAEATSRQKSEFLARISHELRTPLNAIMGFSEVMRLERFGEIENEKYKSYVNDIYSSGGHLLSLINDLLDLSKVESGKLELNFTSVNLNDVADNAIRMMQETATAARVVLRKAFPAKLPNVVADLRAMRQIMLNLLSNALKFTDPGGQVIISASLLESGELVLRVKDTGIGMSDEQLKDALEPFRRVETQGRDVPGTGLGLPLTKALAEANRAKFAISSELRKGTLVEITFPTPRVLAE